MLNFIKRASHSLSLHRDTPLNNASIPFQFNSANLSKAKNIIGKYPSQYIKAAIIPLLDLAQRQNGFTSIGVMNYVAQLVNVPPMRVYEVASFYTMFNREPVGKYFVQVCTTTPCQLCGSDSVLEAVTKHLGVAVGETTKDGLFTIVEVECAGACSNAPVMAVNDDYFEDLSGEAAVKVLQNIQDGKPVKIGPQSSRKSSEPITGLTSLLSEPTGPGFGIRPDL